MSTYISEHSYIIDNFRACFRCALSNREVKHFHFSVKRRTCHRQFNKLLSAPIKKLTYKKVQIEQINEDKPLSDITTS